jgi:glycosyltransferase involved in cell wall biosynthesis
MVIPNGVDLTKYSPVFQKNSSFLAKYNLPQDKNIFLYLGRLDPDKNIEFLIQSFTKLNNSNSILLIVGVGGLAKYLKKIINSYKGIHVISDHDQKDISLFYQNSDVFVTASKIEVQSLTALEAMASGLPIIAARAGGMIDLCKDSVNGYLFKPDDENDFINKVNLLLGNKVKFGEMKKASRRLAEEHDLNHCLQKYVDLYQNI